MLIKIQRYFEQFIQLEPTAEEQQSHLNRAIAALMIEMTRADNQVNQAESEHLRHILAQRYQIPEAELETLSSLADEELRQATDYYQFTRLINDNFELGQKITMIRHLWELAYIDGKIDSHEEHYLRKIADLLFVPHSEFIKAKLKVIDSADH